MLSAVLALFDGVCVYARSKYLEHFMEYNAIGGMTTDNGTSNSNRATNWAIKC